MTRLDDLAHFLDGEVRREVKHLRELEAWAYAQQPFKVGDQAVISKTPSINERSGWWTHREFLVEGSTCVVTEVYFLNNHWGVLICPDVQWSASDRSGRRTGERLSHFYFDPTHLRPRVDGDEPLTVPADAKPWGAA